MLAYNEIVPKKIIVLDGEPFIVLSSHVFRKQQRKPVNQTKLRSLVSGKVLDRTFHQSESAEEAALEKKDALFIYRNRGEAWFHWAGSPGERFSIPEERVGDAVRFLPERTPVVGLLYNGAVISVEVPVKVELAVADAPPAVRGNTAQGGTKQITLETGAVITAPLFIQTGDTVRVNTETGAYTERVVKK